MTRPLWGWLIGGVFAGSAAAAFVFLALDMYHGLYSLAALSAAQLGASVAGLLWWLTPPR